MANLPPHKTHLTVSAKTEFTAQPADAGLGHHLRLAISTHLCAFACDRKPLPDYFLIEQKRGCGDLGFGHHGLLFF